MEHKSPALTLSEVVDEYLASIFDNSRKYYKNYLIHAKWVWKDLFWNTLRTVKHKYVEIKYDAQGRPFFFIPRDAVKVFSVQLTDECGNLLELTENNAFNVMALPPAGRGCGCEQCSCTVDACGGIDELSVRTIDRLIDGTTYQEKVWNKLLPSGDIIEIRHIPVKDFSDSVSYTIRTIEQQRTIVSLEVKPCGCLKSNAFNSDHLKRYNCYGFSKVGTCSLEAVHDWHCQSPGEFKVHDGRIYLKNHNAKATHAILSYQTNGECPYEEILIPEEVVNAMHFGIRYRVAALSGANRLAIRETYRNYRMTVDELDYLLNPVSANEFLNVQMAIPKWGPSSDCFNGFDVRVYSTGPSELAVQMLIKDAVDKALASAPPKVVTQPPVDSGGGGTPPPVTSDHVQYSDQYSSQYA